MDSQYSGPRAEPFAETPDARFTYLDVGREDLLAQVLAAIEDGASTIVLTGASGIGKTSFLLCLAEAIEQSDVLRAVGREPIVCCEEETETSADTIATVLRRGPGDGDAIGVLLVDDADQLDEPARRDLWEMVSDRDRSEGQCCLVMTALPRPGHARPPEEPELITAAEHTLDLLPIDVSEVDALVRHRLTAAGRGRSELFAPDAMERIAYFGKGHPGRIVRLCGYCLELAGERRQWPVSGDLVKEAAYTLFLPGHLQKLARGLSSHHAPRQPRTEEAVAKAPPGRADAAALPRGERTPPPAPSGAGNGSHPASPPARASLQPTMPAPPPESPPRPRRKGGTHRRRLGLAAVAALLLLAAATVVVVATQGPSRTAEGQTEIAAPVARYEQETAPADSGGAGESAVEDDAAVLAATEAATGAEAGAETTQAERALPESAGGTAKAEAADEAMPERLKKAFGTPSTRAAADTAGPESASPPVPSPAGAAGATGTAETTVGAGSPDTTPDISTDTADAAEGAPAGAEPVAPPAAETSSGPLAAAPLEGERSAAEPLTPNRVADVQTMLARLGYRPGPIDGLVGPRTRSAVRAFQRDENMLADGTISNVLVAALERRLGSPTVTPQGAAEGSTLHAMGPGTVDARDALRRYCQAHRQSSVYDRVTGQVVACSRVVDTR